MVSSGVLWKETVGYCIRVTARRGAGTESSRGGNRRKRKTGQHRDHLGNQDDHQRVEYPRVADNIAKPEKHNDAQNRQSAGCKDPSERSEAIGIRCRVVSGFEIQRIAHSLGKA